MRSYGSTSTRRQAATRRSVLIVRAAFVTIARSTVDAFDDMAKSGEVLVPGVTRSLSYR
jgi:hypothetical protein